MNNTLFDDDTLKKAIKISCEQELMDLDDEIRHAGPPAFSGEFHEKMQVLRKGRQKKKPAMLRHKKFPLRYVLIAALLFMLSTATVFASGRIRNILYNVYVTLFPDHLGVENKEGILEENPDFEPIPYEPFYIPGGYQKTYDDIDMTVGMRYTTYEEGNNVLIFSQNVARTAESVITSDGSTIEVIIIQGREAVYSTDGEYTSIVFELDGYTFYITAPLKKEEMIKVADSVSPSE